MKEVAGTLKSVLDHPDGVAILDRTSSVLSLAVDFIERWSLDLYTRKPGPAVNAHGEFEGTDLDMATFVSALVNRGAVINLPVYKGMRAAQQREGERLVSKDNRHGNLTGIFANKEVFSFGVRVDDQNVVTTDSITGRETTGAPRNFAVMDVKGVWHDGWRTIEFSPSAKENEFLQDKQLWTGNQLVFKNFVHPNRWISFYGQYYYLTKMLIQRLEEEAQHLHSEAKRLDGLGIKLPPGEGKKEWPKTTTKEEMKSIKVAAFQVEIDIPWGESEFPSQPETVEGLKEALSVRKNIVYNLVPKLRFATRCVEFAVFKHGFKDEEVPERVGSFYKNEHLPGWIKNAKWERDYVVPGKRNKWNRLVLFQPAVGEIGVSLRYRVYEKSERVPINRE